MPEAAVIYLEMSRDELHGGEGWGFSTCLWSPTEKVSGGRWPFWQKILDVRAGDAVLHLRGIGHDAAFVGHSVASQDGYVTQDRPPSPGQWDFSKRFYRADLHSFTLLQRPIRLAEVFERRRAELETYFDVNKTRSTKSNIFYVRQSGRLQCLNGAYLSEVDQELFAALFGIDPTARVGTRASFVSVETGQQLSWVGTRLGQAAFSREIRKLYGHACCFPSCEVRDGRFLVASHIARWSDNQGLRGQLGNGLCLCLIHDKAFEIGLFSLDEECRVIVHPNTRSGTAALDRSLAQAHGHKITCGNVVPMSEALAEHRARVKCDLEAWR